MNTPIPCHALPTPSPPPESFQFYQRHNIEKPLTPEPEEYDLVKKPIKPVHKTTTRPFVTRWLNVIQKLLKELDGRDKLMKVIQYFIKILLHYKLVHAKHWSTITSNFSMTRKLLRLGTAIGPIGKFSLKNNSISESLILSNAIVNNISDDVFCLYKLGVFGSYLGDRSERISAYCWFAGIFIDLNDNLKSMLKLQKQSKTESNLQEIKKKIFVTEISIIKLLMDGIFCACDIWKPTHSPSTQAWSGFLSGVLAGYKLWIKFSV